MCKKKETQEEYCLRRERQGTRRTIIRRLRLLRLSGEQNHRCCYCGQQTWHPNIDDGGSVPHSAKRRATLEHVKTQKSGGKDTKFNLAMACAQCNSTRGELKLEDFYRLISNTESKGVPLSKAAKRAKLKEKKRRSEKGKTKAAKTFRLVILSALFYPDLFAEVSAEAIPKFKVLDQKARNPLNSLGAVRKRVRENNMVYL